MLFRKVLSIIDVLINTQLTKSWVYFAKQVRNLILEEQQECFYTPSMNRCPMVTIAEILALAENKDDEQTGLFYR